VLIVEPPAHVSIYQLLRARHVVFERAALTALEEALKAMRDPREVLIRPVMPRRRCARRRNGTPWAFRVRPDANKVEIRAAVEAVVHVKVPRPHGVLRGQAQADGPLRRAPPRWKKPS